MNEPKIVRATIGPMPKSVFDAMPSVNAEFDDGTQAELFWFYPDELSFTESEFVGLTRTQALELRHRKDVAYLRS